PVVLLHGLSDSWHSYERVLPHLPPSIHAFALSQRGHGDSECPESGYGPRDFAADVAAFLDTLNLGQAIIVGHSLGGTVAQRFAIDYRERMLGLVLVNSFASFRSNPVVVEFQNALATLTDPIDATFAREFQESTLVQPVPPAFLDTVVSESQKVPARVWRAVMEDFLEAEVFGELDAVRAPTLMIWGAQDAYVPRSDQEALVAAITDARLVVYPGAGHALHWEEPERFAADLTAFVESLVP
ncbi:MAG: alpha/beta hydrolase, partial [Chloroflexia bacterium]|nr:alpha/beta hydrolase [Chloroflexia bacterium]